MNQADHHSDNAATAVPFLKWAGGKRWLIKKYPEILKGVSFKRYVEPFLGGGAVFFHLKPRDAIISDSNEELINCYISIRDNWRGVKELLECHQEMHSKNYYYDMRSKKFNDNIDRAAQFLYLNRVCWNGLYRVNLRGEFNVPMGTKTSVVLETDDFKGTSDVLKKAKIFCSDFGNIIDKAKCGDFLFIDPPYTVQHNFNGFIKYNERIFSWEDQVRLSSSVCAAAERGVRALVLNANHASVRALYEGMGRFYILDRHSVLAANSAHRGLASELAVLV